MAAPLPAFVYSAGSCPSASSFADCCSRSNLQAFAKETHRARMDGTSSLAKDLLQSWQMMEVTQAATAAMMGKKIRIYVPPCGRMIEVALGISCEIATINNAMFQHVIDKGLEPPTLPCSIRIDDRLASECAESNYSRIDSLKNILKECAKGEPFGFNLWPAPPGVTSETWFAYHFDIPYLDRRCYERANEGNDRTAANRLSVADILSGDSGPGVATTGTLFILDNEAANAGVTALKVSETSPSTTAPVRNGQMFEAKPVSGSINKYTTSYFGEYVVSRAPKPQPSEKSQLGAMWEKRDAEAMQELKSAKGAKGMFKAGLKMGKNKIGRLVDEQKHGGGELR